MDTLTRLRIAAPIVVGVVVLDQLTKWWALEALGDGDVIEVFPTLELELARNSGFSFSTGSGSGPLVAVVVVALIGVLSVFAARATSRLRVALIACVIGGALGNLVDRVFRADDGLLSGEVVDFIDVTWYAVFNVADSFVVCGAIALVAVEWLGARRDAGTPARPDDADVEPVSEPADDAAD